MFKVKDIFRCNNLQVGSFRNITILGKEIPEIVKSMEFILIRDFSGKKTIHLAVNLHDRR